MLADANPPTYLTRHAAARIWRNIADDPDIPEAVRLTLLPHLPGIEADPVGFDWWAAYYDKDVFTYDITSASTPEAAIAADFVAAEAAYSAAATHAYSATANADRAVRLGCAGSDRIGLALHFLAEAEGMSTTDAWDLAGLVMVE